MRLVERTIRIADPDDECRIVEPESVCDGSRLPVLLTEENRSGNDESINANDMS
ncbi:MAG: hypothetical protein ACLFN1_06465 [Bacteroidales bacterium]